MAGPSRSGVDVAPPGRRSPIAPHAVCEYRDRPQREWHGANLSVPVTLELVFLHPINVLPRHNAGRSSAIFVALRSH
jgi:hypothetical protein